MKNIAHTLILFAFLSCGHESEKKQSDGKLLAVNAKSKSEKPAGKFGPYYGCWTGKLPLTAPAAISGKPIAIALSRIDATGFAIGSCSIGEFPSVFHGKLTTDTTGKRIEFNYWLTDRKETFQFELSLETPLVGYVSLASRNAKKMPVRFELAEKAFVYDASAATDTERYNDWSHPRMDKASTGEEYESEYIPTSTDASNGINASIKPLNESDLKNLKKTDLALVRNTVFARHGLIFTNENLARYYSRFSWYMPVYSNVDPDLTKIEKSNLKLINRFEKYAEDYYEYFGR